MNYRDLSYEELENQMREFGYPKFRAKQFFQWIHKQPIEKMEEITVFSKKMREDLQAKGSLSLPKCVDEMQSLIDPTRKFLFQMSDGHIVESVAMFYQHGISLCLSTQVGCKMGCVFCATGKEGFIRNLTPSEILGQVIMIEKILGEKSTNLVMMGSGEPLDNWDAVKAFFTIIHHPEGRGMGYRHITLSTAGVVPNIYAMAESGIPVNLSVSLHQPFQEKREELMPIAKRYHLPELMKATKNHQKKTGRRTTFEYTLIEGVNDRIEDARQLKDLLRDQNYHLNLIPINPVDPSFKRPKQVFVRKFQKHLQDAGVMNVTIRRELGTDISAACGQLKQRFVAAQEEDNQ
jgi:23S rRNA (adenine2503-C2)-methyltransferase